MDARILKLQRNTYRTEALTLLAALQKYYDSPFQPDQGSLQITLEKCPATLKFIHRQIEATAKGAEGVLDKN